MNYPNDAYGYGLLNLNNIELTAVNNSNDDSNSK